MTLKDHKWIICVDLNMVNPLKVQPRGYVNTYAHYVHNIDGLLAGVMTIMF